MYTSPVLRVDAPTGAFCFLQKHRLIYFECIQVLCYGWTLPQGLFVFFKTQSYICECIQVLCYGWTLLQGLFVFLKNTVLYLCVYKSCVTAPAGARLIFFSVYKSCVTGGRSRMGF